MNGVIDIDSDDSSPYVEVDPTGRYGRYNEILGKGSSKIVYRGFDEYEGIEVAWNQVKLTDFLQRPEDLERLYSEIHLLKTLKHKNIMKFYSSWVDTNQRNINFVTEMFTSGTLRQYRLKHKKVNIRAVKQWCRQILEGLIYLHGHDAPVIHRDLKCDNIFINGNQGQVKIGDLGLAAILRKSHAARCVGTPEFMAPEVYAEEYNELVDIYSFGMCILEMVTFEYPYSECNHPAQIYKKVVSGKKPEALYKVKDPQVRVFVEKCLASVADRLSAKELLEDPFLRCDDGGQDSSGGSHNNDSDEIGSLVRLPSQNGDSSVNGCGYDGYEPDHEYEHLTLESATSEIELFSSLDDGNSVNGDITIQGRRRGNGDIFLRLRITDKEGRVRNIYFPFDIEIDTALSVATEMVSELEINDQDVTKIADMIDGEIELLVPDWKRGLSVDEAPEYTELENDGGYINDINNSCNNSDNSSISRKINEDQHHLEKNSNNSNSGRLKALFTKEIGKAEDDCVPKVTLADFIAFGSPAARRVHLLRSSSHGSTSMRGRFEEITTGKSGTVSGAMEYADIGIQHERRPSWIFHESTKFDFDETDEQDESSSEMDRRRIRKALARDPRTPYNSPTSSVVDDTEHYSEARKDLSILKAKYQMQLRELRDQHISREKPPLIAPRKDYSELKRDKMKPFRSKERGLDDNDLKNALRRHFSPHFPWDFSQSKRSGLRNRKLQSESCSPENTVTSDDIQRGPYFQPSLKRTTSLPLDVVDC